MRGMMGDAFRGAVFKGILKALARADRTERVCMSREAESDAHTLVQMVELTCSYSGLSETHFLRSRRMLAKRKLANAAVQPNDSER